MRFSGFLQKSRYVRSVVALGERFNSAGRKCPAVGRPKPRGFTLIELLVVIAILSLLIAMMVPVVGKVLGRAKSAKCKSNLHQIGIANLSYASEHDGFLNYQQHGNGGTPGFSGTWGSRIVPYLQEYSGGDKDRGRVWRCPEQLDGGFIGWPSFAVSAAVLRDRSMSTDPGSPRRIYEFESPSRKIHMMDDRRGTIFTVTQFYSRENGGSIPLRHVGGTANVLFIDGHVSAYAAPPLPLFRDDTNAKQWLRHDSPPPDEL